MNDLANYSQGQNYFGYEGGGGEALKKSFWSLVRRQAIPGFSSAASQASGTATVHNY